MRKTLLKQTFGIFGILALVVLLLACPNVPVNQEQQGMVKVSFSVTDNMARTVLPQVSLEDVASYKLLGGRNSTTETVLVESFTSTVTSVSLDPGTWNFTLDAYNESGGHILQGKVQNQQITLSGTNQVSFTLSVINSGTGSIQITLNFPESAGITHISTNGDITSESFTLSDNSNFVYTKNDIAAGDYLINFELYRGEVLRTVVSELVLVRNNLTSSKTITLVGDNLKPLPTFELTINLSDIIEWELTEQSAYAIANENKAFAVTGTYTTYRWYLDGTQVGTSSSYIFNKPAGIYQLVVVVTNSAGESRSGRCRITVESAPIFSENFEGATHSFIIVNGSQTNKWEVGNAVAADGMRSAYISNDGGVSNSYTITSASTVHMYSDIFFPVSSEPYTLSFNWRAQGQGTLTPVDYLRVCLADTTATPIAGSQPYIGTVLGTYNYSGSSTWNLANIIIPAFYSGQTMRLVFTWVNNASSGSQPPVAVDNIVLTKGSSSTRTFNVTYSINNGSGTTPTAHSIREGYSLILDDGGGFSRSGFIFGGWNTSANGTGLSYDAGNLYTPSSSVILYAKWIPMYTVNYNINGGIGITPATQTIREGYSVLLPDGERFTRGDETFLGWYYIAANGTGMTYAANTLYTPTNNVTLYARWSTIFREDFEETTHAFILVNGSQTNQWRVGTAVAAPGGGTRSAYISNNNGTSNAYTITSASTVHMYSDIFFPVSSEPYTLIFNWRAQGESSLFDYLRVRLVETSAVITAGSQPSTGTVLGTFYFGGATTWNQATISIPAASNSGTTKRLLFTWVNDNTSGAQPPAAVDNIILQ